MAQELKPGTWNIDATHSIVGFSVRHMMVSKVRGRPAEHERVAQVARQEQRDAHIRSSDFFSVEEYPQFTFRSTGLEAKGEDFVLKGDLTIKGNTHPVELALEFNGATVDPNGLDRAGFAATTPISRKEFGVDIEMPMDSGGVVVGDRITIQIDAEFTRQDG